MADAAEHGRDRDVAVAVGYLRSYEQLLVYLYPPAREIEPPAEEFFDPATIVDPPLKAKEATS